MGWTIFVSVVAALLVAWTALLVALPHPWLPERRVSRRGHRLLRARASAARWVW